MEDVIRRIDMFDVDPGGTAMNDGMRLALEEIEKLGGPGRLSQILVLTDGETSGETDCRQLAQRAAEKKVHLTLMGVGLDWKASLIKDLAKLSEGKWYYIDVNQAEEAERIFVEEFETLAATGFMNVEMHLRPMKDIKIKRIRQVVMNFVANAVKFSAPGSIRISANLTEARDPRLRIAVRDNGPLIPASELPRLFQPRGGAHRGKQRGGDKVPLQRFNFSAQLAERVRKMTAPGHRTVRCARRAAARESR